MISVCHLRAHALTTNGEFCSRERLKSIHDLKCYPRRTISCQLVFYVEKKGIDTFHIFLKFESSIFEDDTPNIDEDMIVSK